MRSGRKQRKTRKNGLEACGRRFNDEERRSAPRAALRPMIDIRSFQAEAQVHPIFPWVSQPTHSETHNGGTAVLAHNPAGGRCGTTCNDPRAYTAVMRLHHIPCRCNIERCSTALFQVPRPGPPRQVAPGDAAAIVPGLGHEWWRSRAANEACALCCVVCRRRWRKPEPFPLAAHISSEMAYPSHAAGRCVQCPVPWCPCGVSRRHGVVRTVAWLRAPPRDVSTIPQLCRRAWRRHSRISPSSSPSVPSELQELSVRAERRLCHVSANEPRVHATAAALPNRARAHRQSR